MKSLIVNCGVLCVGILGAGKFLRPTLAEIAAPPRVLQTGQFKYEIHEAAFMASNLPQLLRVGVPLGFLTDGDPAGLQSDGDIKGYFASLAESATKKQAGVKKALEESSKPITGTAPAPSTPAPPLEQPVSGLDLAAFRECALRALPKLRLALSLENKPERADDLAMYREDLTQLRFGVSGASSRGMVCGQYLGTLAIDSVDFVFDVKLLSALVARSNAAELKALLTALVASFRPESAVAGNPLWTYYWNSLSLAAVFTSAPLPTFADLNTRVSDGELTETLENMPPEVKVSGANMPRQAITDIGIKLANEILKKEGL